MKKLLPKLIASILALAVSASLVAMSSYAWYTMSAAPEVNGIQVNIGGTDTILVAPDIVVKGEDGIVRHYPGKFGQTLDFDHESYAYLKTLAGLVPVSTADGLNWVVADYYDQDDPEVQAGLAVDGQIKNPANFQVDNRLQFANLTEENEKGSYIYLDFWLVAPVDGYYIRVSTGDETEQTGSYVITLPEPGTDENGNMTLVETSEAAAASVRVGFLTSYDWSSLQDVAAYKESAAYNENYEYLIGCYQEPGDFLDLYSASENWFSIYEPNGNLHPATGEGHYQITMPLGVTDGVIQPMDIYERLSVQVTSTWKTVVNESTQEQETLLSQLFHGAILDPRAEAMTEEELMSYFYRDRLQMLLQPYLTRGQFVESTLSLYNSAANGSVSADSYILNPASLRGATSDVYITMLRKDTPQRIRMFIWLEGQDPDCVNSEASKIAVNIELAGGSGK